ncbi:MAG TPA: response regulator [Anaerolineae bacterium]|nr:response regulator [Anaerolineae bacterium]
MAKILIVDDSALARRILRQTLESNGHAVLEAKDGPTALERFTQERPDLVLLDLVMEGMTGLETLQRIREIAPDARVIIATADIQQATRAEAESTGACGYITKPFKQAQVLEAVRRALKGGEDEVERNAA